MKKLTKCLVNILTKQSDCVIKKLVAATVNLRTDNVVPEKW